MRPDKAWEEEDTAGGALAESTPLGVKELLLLPEARGFVRLGARGLSPAVDEEFGGWAERSEEGRDKAAAGAAKELAVERELFVDEMLLPPLLLEGCCWCCWCCWGCCCWGCWGCCC